MHESIQLCHFLLFKIYDTPSHNDEISLLPKNSGSTNSKFCILKPFLLYKRVELTINEIKNNNNIAMPNICISIIDAQLYSYLSSLIH